MALSDGHPQADMGCGVRAMAVAPSLAISHGTGARAIVVSPDVRVHTNRDCGREIDGVVEIHMENHLQDMEVHLEQMEHALEIELEQLEHQLEQQFEQQFEYEFQAQKEMEARAKFQEAMGQLEAAQVKVRVKRAGAGEG